MANTSAMKWNLPEAVVEMIDIAKITEADMAWGQDTDDYYYSDVEGERPQCARTPRVVREYDEILQSPAVRSPLKEFQDKVGNDALNWVEVYGKVSSTLGNFQAVEELMQNVLKTMEEISKKCSGSPKAAALLKPEMGSLNDTLKLMRRCLKQGASQCPLTGLTAMRTFFKEMCEDAAACKVAQTAAEQKVTEKENELSRVRHILKERSDELLQAQLQLTEETKRHEEEKRKFMAGNTTDSSILGTRKRSHVRRIDSDQEDASTPTDTEMDWQRDRLQKGFADGHLTTVRKTSGTQAMVR